MAELRGGCGSCKVGHQKDNDRHGTYNMTYSTAQMKTKHPNITQRDFKYFFFLMNNDKKKEYDSTGHTETKIREVLFTSAMYKTS